MTRIRWSSALLIACLVGQLWFTIYASTSEQRHARWHAVMATPMWPAYNDLHVIATGWDQTRRGVDPLASPPSQSLYNYPRLWLEPAHLGLGAGATPYVGALLTAVFLFTVAMLIRGLDVFSLVVGLALVWSPPWLLAIERGNSDLLVFTLLVWALWCATLRTGGEIVSAAGVTFAAMLKLYPAAAFLGLLRASDRRQVAKAVIVAIIFGVYLVAIRDQLAAIYRKTLLGTSWSYGARFAIKEYLSYAGMNPTARLLTVLQSGIVALVAAAAGFGWFRLRIKITAETAAALTFFIAGSAIFVATFLIGHNWCYRLVFLGLLLPQLNRWSNGEHRRAALTITAFLVASCWLVGRDPGRLFLAGQACTVGLAISLAATCAGALRARLSPSCIGIPLTPPEAGLSRFERLLCLVLVVVLVGGFVASVAPVVTANPDDADFVAAAHDPAIARQLVAADLALGRFYAPLKFEVLNAAYAHAGSRGVSVWRFALLTAEALLLGGLIGTVAESEPAGWLGAVLVAAFLQFVPTYTPVVSYPQLGLGMIFCLGSLWAWHRGCRTGSPAWRLLAVALFAASLLAHEFFLSLLPVHLAVGFRASRWRSLRHVWSLFAIGAVYTTGYVAVAHAGRGAGYGGTQPHFAVAEVAGTVARQTLSTVPGVELALDRSASEGLRSAANASKLVGHELRWPDILTTLVVIPVVWLLGVKVGAGRHALLLGAVTITLACLPTVMIALTRKYQMWSHHRIFPYTYAYYATYFIVGGVVFGLQAAWSGLRPRMARVVVAVFALGAGCVSIICRMTSREAVEQVQSHGTGFLHRFPDGVPPRSPPPPQR